MSFWISIIFAAVVALLVDAYFFNQGYDSFLFHHKTPEEKRIREAKIRILEQKVDARTFGLPNSLPKDRP
jgi:hypothetical protein